MQEFLMFLDRYYHLSNSQDTLEGIHSGSCTADPDVRDEHND